MKPTPVRMPSGSRIKSITPNDSAVLPSTDSRMLAWIMATEAARPTRIVVRRPAACPRAPRLSPMMAPATIVSASRIARSAHDGESGMFMGFRRDGCRKVPDIPDLALTANVTRATVRGKGSDYDQVIIRCFHVLGPHVQKHETVRSIEKECGKLSAACRARR